jgi:hypothetical protein
MWEDFTKLIDQKIALATKTLVGTNDYEHILRYQGAVRELERLKYLREEVNGRENS